MKTYSVLENFGRGHDRYIGEIDGESAKDAFKNAVIKYFDAKKYEKYTSFFVYNQKESLVYERNGDFLSYGYNSKGQRDSCRVFFTSLKSVIEKILFDESFRKSTEGFESAIKTLI